MVEEMPSVSITHGLRQLDHQPVALEVNKPKSAGCPRCRLDKIRFVKPVKLPRFSFKPGEEWELPQVRYQVDGSAELGGGTIPAGSFEIVTPDESKACGCTCKGDRPRLSTGGT